MKNLCFFTTTLFALLFIACTQSEEEPAPSCDAPVTIDRLQPSDNPIGGPVLIVGTGFTGNSTLKFNDISAPIEMITGSQIATRVPDGLDPGLVEITVSNGELCTDMRDFNLTINYPLNLPVSPPNIILPNEGIAFPIQVDNGKMINWKNFYDTSHTLSYLFFQESGPISFGEEVFNGKGYEVVGSQNMETNKVEITVMRDAPYPTENYEGGYYTFTIEKDGDLVTDNFLLIFSKSNGRQYLFTRN